MKHISDYLKFVLIASILFYGCSESGKQIKETNNADSTRTEAGNVEEPVAKAGNGLLLGVKDGGTVTTYFVTFLYPDIIIERLPEYILSPQQDGFYVIQPMSYTEDKECTFEDEYDEYGGGTQTTTCSCSYSGVLVSKANESEYKKAYSNLYNDLSESAAAFVDCNVSASYYENIEFVGNDFIQLTVGGSDSECAPDGPGGGYEKDTIISISGDAISPYAKDHLTDNELYTAHSDLFESSYETEEINKDVWGYCEPEDMLIYLGRKKGKLMLYVRNDIGRSLQDVTEQTIVSKIAPATFYKNNPDAPVDKLKDTYPEAEDFFISPDGDYAGVLLRKEGEIVFRYLPTGERIGSIEIGWKNIVMEDWCTTSYWEKWNEEVQKSKTYIK